MGNKRLDALVKIKQLHQEPSNQDEIEALVESGKVRLVDAENTDLSIESRFDLAYNSAHSLALAALRKSGYRSVNRFLVFQCLEHTVGLPPAQWRVLSAAQDKRNSAEYEGVFDVNEELVGALIRVTNQLLLLLCSDEASGSS